MALSLPALWLGATPAAAACDAWVEIGPRRAYLGQAIEHRTIVIQPEGQTPEWTRPLGFPGFRSEALEATAAKRGVRDGAKAVRVETSRLLFPVRSGTLRLPPGRLRCGNLELEVPSPTVRALPWPAAGRPEDFTGVVGELTIGAASEPTVALGTTARVRVTSRGAANLWDATPKLRVRPSDTEVFRRAPRIGLRGSASPKAIRHDVFDLVPRHAGELQIEPLRIAYLDPATGHYGIAETEPLRIRVLPAALAPSAGSPGARRPLAGGAGGRRWGASIRVWTLWAVLLGLGWAGAIRLRRRGSADPVRAALRDFDQADGPGARSAALERALSARLAQGGLDPTRRSRSELLVRSPDESTRECVRALEELERIRFAGGGHGAGLDERLAEIRRLIARLRSHRRRSRRTWVQARPRTLR